MIDSGAFFDAPLCRLMGQGRRALDNSIDPCALSSLWVDALVNSS